MTEKCVLAVDAGSGGGRAYIIDLNGKLISFASKAWEYYVPEDAAPLGKEFDAGHFWDIICQLIREAIQKAAVNPVDIMAVSSASQREGVIFLDKDGQELYAGPNIDIRGLIEGFTIDGEHGQEVYDITGHKPSLLFAPARLKWFQANRPKIYERVTTVLSIGDWILFKLCGEKIGEVSLAADLGVFDINQVKWSERLIKLLDLPDDIWPRVVESGTKLATVSKAAVEQTGLSHGTAVVAGGADTQCGLLGMNIKDQSQVGVVAGWSGVLQMSLDKPIIDPQGRIWTGCHAFPGKWVLESNAQECGGGYRWVKDMLFGAMVSEQEAYSRMDDMAQSTPIGAEGTLAFIGPRVMDMASLRPNLGGIILPITPTVKNMERKHLVRAAMENIGYAVKVNLGQLEEISGMNAEKICVGGGLTQSRVLIQIMADVLGMPVTSFETPWVTAYGIAICAAVGAGVYRNLEQSISALQPASRMVEPDPQASEQYAALYDKWLKSADWLNDLTDNL